MGSVRIGQQIWDEWGGRLQRTLPYKCCSPNTAPNTSACVQEHNSINPTPPGSLWAPSGFNGSTVYIDIFAI